MDEVRTLNIQGGARLTVPASIECFSTYILLEQEDWFEDEIRFVRRWLRPDMRAVDVGANVGVYTEAMARAVGPGGRVWAFEPTPAAADYLRRNIELNSMRNVIVSSAAVSDREGATAFSVGANSETNAIATPDHAGDDVVQVPAVTLDRTASEHGWTDVDLVKLDVEGHEFEVIRGATRFLASNSPLIMFEIMAGAAVDLRALDPLADLGYGFYRLLPGQLCLVPFDRSKPTGSNQVNLFACKRERRRQLAADGFLAEPDLARAIKPDSRAWPGYADAAPYARAFSARWKSGPEPASDDGARAYLEGLAAFAESRDPARNLVERLDSLWLALERVAQAMAAEDTLSRRISLARLAWEAGIRGAAIVSLTKAARRMQVEGARTGAEPFLSPSPRHEWISADRPAEEWLETAVVEQLERLRLHSSLFGGTSSLEVIEPVLGRRYGSPEMARRWQLVRMRCGLQSEPEPTPLLCRRSEENLNPEFWCVRPQ